MTAQTGQALAKLFFFFSLAAQHHRMPETTSSIHCTHWAQWRGSTSWVVPALPDRDFVPLPAPEIDGSPETLTFALIRRCGCSYSMESILRHHFFFFSRASLPLHSPCYPIFQHPSASDLETARPSHPCFAAIEVRRGLTVKFVRVFPHFLITQLAEWSCTCSISTTVPRVLRVRESTVQFSNVA